MKCKACQRNVRKTQRALVLIGPNVIKPGRVCSACAGLGWLLVLSEPVPPPRSDTPESAGRKARAAAAALASFKRTFGDDS